MNEAELLAIRLSAEKERRRRKSEEMQAIVDKCRRSPEWFILSFVRIDDPQGEEPDRPFALWPDQKSLLEMFRTEILLIVLKARQLGISWLACAYALWLCLFFSGKVVLLFSQGQSEADDLLRRVRAMYDRLPEDLRRALPALEASTTQRLVWFNGSRIMSLPATSKAGRTFTASLVIMDEAAHMEYAQSLYTALKPTIDGGGKLIIISTANGVGNLFWQLWDMAERGKNRFMPVFLGWRTRPGRDDNWYRNIVAEALENLPLVKQEYPSTAEEAFQSTGQERFLTTISWWDICRVRYEDLPPLGRSPVVIGLDAAIGRKDSPSDCFGIVAVSLHPDDHTKVVVRYVQKWQVPTGMKLHFRSLEGEEPGPEDILERLCKEMKVLCITYDAYQLADLADRHEWKDGIWWEDFPQQSKRLEADRQLLQVILERRILHTGESDLREHIENADRKVTEGNAMRIVQGARGKIDLTVALSMAVHMILNLNL